MRYLLELVAHFRLDMKIQESFSKRRTPEYRAWDNMIQRCYNPGYIRSKNYKGRGIKVCDRWLESFDNFLEDMGERPSSNHSLDRINNDGNYEPRNCRWATPVDQMANSSNYLLSNNPYPGVRVIKSASGIKYDVKFERLGNKVCMGRFTDLEDAVSAKLSGFYSFI